MAQKSLCWFTDGFTGATGEGAAPYTQDEFALYNRVLFGEGVVFSSANNGLEVTGTASPLSISEGRMQIRGFTFASSDVETIAVTTPLIGTTGGRVVVRADYSTATVRIALKMSSDGVASVPALTQIDNTTWERSLAIFTITTGGVITVTDDRIWAFTNLARQDGTTITRDSQNRFGVANGGITTAKIADGAVTTDKIADDAVTTDKIGNEIVPLIGRQGGSATDWDVAGTTDYSVGEVAMQAGVASGVMTTGDNVVTMDSIVFPVAFANQPIVTALVRMRESGYSFDIVSAGASTTEVQFTLRNSNGANVPSNIDFVVNWLAIGPRA